MNLAEHSFGEASRAAALANVNAASEADREREAAEAQRQQVLQRAITAVPGTHIDSARQNEQDDANNSMSRLNDN